MQLLIAMVTVYHWLITDYGNFAAIAKPYVYVPSEIFLDVLSDHYFRLPLIQMFISVKNVQLSTWHIFTHYIREQATQLLDGTYPFRSPWRRANSAKLFCTTSFYSWVNPSSVVPNNTHSREVLDGESRRRHFVAWTLSILIVCCSTWIISYNSKLSISSRWLFLSSCMVSASDCGPGEHDSLPSLALGCGRSHSSMIYVVILLRWNYDVAMLTIAFRNQSKFENTPSVIFKSNVCLYHTFSIAVNQH